MTISGIRLSLLQILSGISYIPKYKPMKGLESLRNPDL